VRVGEEARAAHLTKLRIRQAQLLEAAAKEMSGKNVDLLLERGHLPLISLGSTVEEVVLDRSSNGETFVCRHSTSAVLIFSPCVFCS
jgi:hypothetical protein